jgi:hypothetical protein
MANTACDLLLDGRINKSDPYSAFSVALSVASQAGVAARHVEEIADASASTA